MDKGEYDKDQLCGYYTNAETRIDMTKESKREGVGPYFDDPFMRYQQTGYSSSFSFAVTVEERAWHAPEAP